MQIIPGNYELFYEVGPDRPTLLRSAVPDRRTCAEAEQVGTRVGYGATARRLAPPAAASLKAAMTGRVQADPYEASTTQHTTWRHELRV